MPFRNNPAADAETWADEPQTNPGVAEADEYAPGVLAGVEVSDQENVDLDPKLKNALKNLKVKAEKRDYPARLIEVIQAWESALFYRGYQFLIPQRGGGWIIPGESTGYGPTMQMDLALLPTNIYSARAQMIIAALTRTVPGVRFAPQDPNSDAQVTAAESADKFVKVIKRNNDLIMIQTDAARYLWTDGRFGYWSRFVKDGQKFGWEEEDVPDDLVPEDLPPDAQGPGPATASETEGGPSENTEGNPRGTEAVEGETSAAGTEAQGYSGEMPGDEEETQEEVTPAPRTPRGQEVRTCHGKLEMKCVPMIANDQCELDVLILEKEVDLGRARGMFPFVADEIKTGGYGTAESGIARLARQNVLLGMQSTYVTSDSIADDVTIQRVWFRPAYFMHCQKPDRDRLIELFPDGCLAVWAGETFCYARNESMDDSWAIGQAYSGDGQNRNAMGTSTIPIQKRLNTWLDLMNDLFVRAVPKKWMDAKAFNIAALKTQTNIPGDIEGFKRQPGTPVNELIFIEPQVTLPATLPDFINKYAGDLAELLSGAYPALAGGDTGSADSGVAIATQRDSALGRLSPTWHAMKNCEASSMKQLVRWGAKCRDKTINEKIPGGETITIEVNDLKGNILCFAESDENFPETYTQKKNGVMQIFTETAKNPQMAEALFNAANLEFLQQMTGLRELYMPEVAARNKQLGEIEMMTAPDAKPTPNPQFVQAQQAIQTMAQEISARGGDPNALAQAQQELANIPPLLTSIPVDGPVDDNDTEALTCWQWLNDPEGRKSKHTNPDGYQNVRLHYLDHVQAAQDKKAGQAAGKPPSVSVNYKDVAGTDSGAATQILQHAGITPTPAPPSPGPGASAPPPVPPAATPAKGPAAPIPAGTPGESGGVPKH